MKIAGKPCTWTKSVEICALNAGELIQISEHPLTLDDARASVSYVQDKISNEAFSGANVKLLNAKNLLIADVEGTTGKSVVSSSSLLPISLSLSLSLSNLSVSLTHNIHTCTHNFPPSPLKLCLVCGLEVSPTHTLH